MDSNLSVGGEIGAGMLSKGLNYMRQCPKAVFLIRDDMHLIEANEHGCEAVESHWMGLAANKVHFNCSKTDAFVKGILKQITLPNPATRRFVLRCADSVFRSYAVSHDPSTYQGENFREYILTIQSDLVCDDENIEILSDAFSLSLSEAEILQLMVTGLKPKEIAYEKGVSLNTVRSHLRTLYAKMNVRNYNDALILAVRLLS